MKRFLVIFLSMAGMLWIGTSSSPGIDNQVDAVSGPTKTASPTGNSLYHRTAEHNLQVGELAIRGEIKNPGKIDLARYYTREVVVKETVLNEANEPVFVGAYRYVGYSLFDLMQDHALEKKNTEIFRPSIDAYVVISNDKGEQVVFSWSEIYHTLSPHQIMLATAVAPIQPYRKEVEYETGTRWHVIAATDLFTYRKLDNPSMITVKSFDQKEYPIIRGMEPMFSPGLQLLIEKEIAMATTPIHDSKEWLKYRTSFYGMGMGYHPIPGFNGVPLFAVTRDMLPLFNPTWLQRGLVCFASIDGYRAIFSYSELFNRADQVIPILAVPEDVNKGGYYRMFLPTDFYADRSVKSLKEIYFFRE